jgi:hypothetical protein
MLNTTSIQVNTQTQKNRTSKPTIRITALYHGHNHTVIEINSKYLWVSQRRFYC